MVVKITQVPSRPHDNAKYQVTANMPPRELGIIAVMSGMYDATIPELTKYAYRRFLGDSHEDAKEFALADRRMAVRDTSSSDRAISVKLPTELVEEAKKLTPGMNQSTMHRFILASISASSPDEALELASRRVGWQKGRPRGGGVTA